MRASAREANQSRDRHSTSATNIAWFVVVIINIRTRSHIVSSGTTASRVISGELTSGNSNSRTSHKTSETLRRYCGQRRMLFAMSAAFPDIALGAFLH